MLGHRSVAFLSLWLASAAAAGDWRNEYPPWGEPGSAMQGAPELYVPILGAFLSSNPRHCMVTQYVLMRLAVSHLNRRDSTYCTAIGQLNNSFEFVYNFWDTGGTGTGVVVQSIDALSEDRDAGVDLGSADARVKVLLGPNTDEEAISLHPFLGGAFSIPYLSWSADGEALSNKGVFGYFFRTAISQLFPMEVTSRFLEMLGYTRINCVYDESVAREITSAAVFEQLKALAPERGIVEVNGFKIDDSNRELATNTALQNQVKNDLLPQLEHTKIRVCGSLLLHADQIMAFFGLAYRANMTTGVGWLWFASEAILALSILDESDAFPAAFQASFGVSMQTAVRGVFFIMPRMSYPQWTLLQQKIEADIGDLQDPELTSMSKCKGGINCTDSPLFKPFNITECQQNGENPLFLPWAYDAVVALAVVTDRLMTKNPGLIPKNFTKEDYTLELRGLNQDPFDCLHGSVEFFDDKQQRSPTMWFVQYQEEGSLVSNPAVVALWTQTSGLAWVPSSTIQWADGTNVTPTSPLTGGVTVKPSGKPPDCDSPLEVWNNTAQRCTSCRSTESPVANSFGAAVCTCAAGNQLYDQNNVLLGCAACPAGRYKDSAGSTTCTLCDAGKVSPNTGGTTCTSCAEGKYSRDDRIACEDCPADKTTEGQGAESILECLCDDGYYGNPANGTCTRCPSGGVTALSIRNYLLQDCLCAKGFYKPVSNPMDCRPCKDGMTCESNSPIRGLQVFGSIERGAPEPEAFQPYGLNFEPRLQEFHWAGDDDTLLVFRCSSRERCPGGGTAGNACGTTRLTDRACSKCPVDFYFNGVTCTACAWWHSNFLVFPVLPLMAGPCIVVLIYYLNMGGQMNWNNLKNAGASLLFLTIAHYQSVYILSQADVEYTEVTLKFLERFSFANDLTTLFNFECRGTGSITGRLLLKALMPGIVATVFLGTWGASWIVSTVTRREWLAMDTDRTLNSFFTTILLFFAGVVDMATVLFKCGVNTEDNKTRTLMLDRGLICYRDQWLSLMAIGTAAVLFWVIGLGSLFVHAVYTAPHWWGEHGRAEARWKFLFVKFRMDVHWWSLTFIVKGMLQNLVFVVFNSGLVQVYGVVTIALAYSFAVIIYMPWRHLILNYVDIAYHQCLLQLTAVIFWYVQEAEEMNNMMFVFASLGLPPALLIICLMLWQRFSDRARGEKSMMMMRVRAAFLEVRPNDDALDIFISELSDWDFLCLRTGMQVLVTELFGLRMRTGLMVKRPSQKRVTTLRNLRNFGGFEEEDDNIHDAIKGSLAAKSTSFQAIVEEETPHRINKRTTKRAYLPEDDDDDDDGAGAGEDEVQTPVATGDTVFLSA